jgi:hypothetical protein
MVQESRYADLLRQLGFEEWEPPHPEFFENPEFKPERPVFVAGWSSDTYVYDETGRHWRAEKEIDLKPYGFDCLMEKCREEQRRLKLN